MIDIIVNSSLLIVLILVFRKVLMGRVSKKIQYALWLVVVCRLLIPGNYFSFVPNVSSIFNTVIEDLIGSVIGDDQASSSANVSDGVNNTKYANGTNDTKELETGLSDGNYSNGNQQQIVQSGENGLANSDASDIGSRDDSNNLKFNKVLSWFKVIWVIGIILVGGVLVVSNIIFSIRIKKDRMYLESYYGLKVYKTSNVSTSCLYGIFSPQIYLTDECLQDDTTKELILVHEYTHFKHLDHLWSLVRMLCVCVYWFNPLVWCAAWVSRCDGEMACDESVLWSIGSNRVTEYGQTLIQMSAVSKSSYGEWVYISTGFGGSKRELKERIVELTKNYKRSAAVSIGLIVIALIIGVIAFGNGNATRLQVFENKLSYESAVDHLHNGIQYDFYEELPEQANCFQDDLVIDVDVEKCLKSKFYNLDNEDSSSALSKSLLKAFEVNNNFYYCETINGHACLVYIKKVDNEYLELVYDTSSEKYALLKFDQLEKQIEKRVWSDNIERETTKYYLLSANVKQYIGKSNVAISESETIEILKKYKGNMDVAQLDITDDINTIMKDYYSDTFGLQNDVKFVMYHNEDMLLCTINIHPEGYCLTSYDPNKDLFDVKVYKYLYRVYENNQYKCCLSDIKIDDLSTINELEDNHQVVLIQ